MLQSFQLLGDYIKSCGVLSKNHVSQMFIIGKIHVFCTKLLLSLFFLQVVILSENVLARIRGIPAGTYWPVRMEDNAL